MSKNLLKTYIEKLESYIPEYEIKKPKVSKATVGWQIDHSLKVINNVCLALQNSDPNTYEGTMSFMGKVLLTLGKFPRGKAKAPKHVIPPEAITKDALITQLKQAEQHLQNIEILPKKAYFKHPMFGYVNKKRANRFLEVHTKHHLKIVKDILNK